MPIIPHMGRPIYCGCTEYFSSWDFIQVPACNQRMPNARESQLGWHGGQLRIPRSCFSHVLETGSHWQHIFFTRHGRAPTWGQDPGLSEREEGILAFTGLRSVGRDRSLSQVISTSCTKGCAWLWEALSSKPEVTLGNVFYASNLMNLDFIADITISCNFSLKCDMYRKLTHA